MWRRAEATAGRDGAGARRPAFAVPLNGPFLTPFTDEVPRRMAQKVLRTGTRLAQHRLGLLSQGPG
jgi:hypothetical protein